MTNEFIVWIKEDKKFYDFELFENDQYYLMGHSKNIDFKTAKENTFNYIGKTDINDKKIYADSSIVEFQIVINNGKLNKPLLKIVSGYFYYSIYWLGYMIKTENGIYSIGAVANDRLKIIDTIQENKLGLIKKDEV